MKRRWPRFDVDTPEGRAEFLRVLAVAVSGMPHEFREYYGPTDTCDVCGKSQKEHGKGGKK